MNKKEITSIKEIIKDLLDLRKNQYDDYIDTLADKKTIADHFGVSDSMKPKQSGFVVSEEEYDEDNPFHLKEDELEVNEDENVIWSKYVSDFDITLIKLNNMLELEEQNSHIKEIEKEMTILNMKKILTVREVTARYGISASSQKNYRNRIHDRLPYSQIGVGGNVKYKVNELESWLENQKK